MDLDDDLCLCFHVTKRKVLNFLRIHQPRRAAQLSDCGGAGTGCGWCRPYLEQLHRQHLLQANLDDVKLPAVAEYASERAEYRRRQSLDP